MALNGMFIVNMTNQKFVFMLRINIMWIKLQINNLIMKIKLLLDRL